VAVTFYVFCGATTVFTHGRDIRATSYFPPSVYVAEAAPENPAKGAPSAGILNGRDLLAQGVEVVEDRAESPFGDLLGLAGADGGLGGSEQGPANE
jgi:hypothetical protein